ncbi:type IX secretion system membrane protein PorP/SprF [uncultured Algibacter sp.]|uniref:PorP/SprF family type IX secretion system membrane protein n=1 Tax=uncultured Algibacter sp. TaxID=298659 RepID=UPI00261CF50E|nr:type IX secretion system membrane protein PorP/SprF [uncultured Algibacter sp.]
MIQKSSLIKGLILVVFTALLSLETKAQQDPQYTHYMYNTMSVNAGYAGQRDVLSATALYRTQWVGIDGAPKTITFGIHSPLRNERIGLGLNIVSDQLGPAKETNIDLNASYTIPVDETGDKELSFGLKAGLHSLDVNLSPENQQTGGDIRLNDFSITSPTLGAALYLHSDKWYLGASIPNILSTEHYEDNGVQQSIATERLHYFLIGGYVFDVSDRTKLKPAFLVKGVSGAPLIADLSLNALFNEKFTLGLAYRWDDSVSGLAGFQVSPGLFVGYAYDATTTALNNFNSGTHEIMLRFELQQIGKILSPRFF